MTRIPWEQLQSTNNQLRLVLSPAELGQVGWLQFTKLLYSNVWRVGKPQLGGGKCSQLPDWKTWSAELPGADRHPRVGAGGRGDRVLCRKAERSQGGACSPEDRAWRGASLAQLGGGRPWPWEAAHPDGGGGEEVGGGGEVHGVKPGRPWRGGGGSPEVEQVEQRLRAPWPRVQTCEGGGGSAGVLCQEPCRQVWRPFCRGGRAL